MRTTLPVSDAPAQPVIAEPARLDRRRWAALIKHIYQADPLLCPQCGGTMKIIAFIEAHQPDLIRRILEHCGLWHDPPPRGPPRSSSPSRPVRSVATAGECPAVSRFTPPSKAEAHRYAQALRVLGVARPIGMPTPTRLADRGTGLWAL